MTGSFLAQRVSLLLVRTIPARRFLFDTAFSPSKCSSRHIHIRRSSCYAKLSGCGTAASITNGTRTLLTPQPVREVDYEYSMITRATRLYKDGPSDGYELLRVGRILAEQPVLANGRASSSKLSWGFVKYQNSRQANQLSFSGLRRIDR